MVVISTRPSRGIGQLDAPWSRTMALPGAASAVAHARRETGDRLTAEALNGLGYSKSKYYRRKYRPRTAYRSGMSLFGLGASTGNIPPWALWAGGGLAAGAAVGYLFLRKK